MIETFIEKANFLKPKQISRESGDLQTYGRDWTKSVLPDPCAIVFPESSEEVSQIAKLCSEINLPLVPSGGRTGLAGGAVAGKKELVLSLERMRAISAVDPVAQVVRVQAGAVTEAVHHRCAEFGLTWPVDFASKGSSHVGGNIATNAGGVRVIRYGLTRNWVLGLKVVLMNGQILDLNGALEKNNTGFDLRQAFIGTEGTLGIITEATLKLCPLPKESDVLFFGLENLDQVFNLFLRARQSGFTLNAFECLSSSCLEATLKNRNFAAPFDQKYAQYVLIEMEKPQSDQGQQDLQNWIEKLFADGLVLDGTLAQSPKDAATFWQMREGVAESLANIGKLHKHDISLPIENLRSFLKEWEAGLGNSYQGMEPHIFGHIGDGNLHVNIIKPATMSDDEFRSKTSRMDEIMFKILQKFQGSVSAEHGIGILKKNLLKFSKSEEEIQLLRSLKKVFDPKGLLNPGKILD